MADYLLVKDADDFILSHSDSQMAMAGHRLVDVAAQAITGDTLPTDKKNMAGGTLTAGFVYSKPVLIDYSARDGAWSDSKLDYYTDEAFDISLSGPLELKVKSNDKQAVTSGEWTELTTAYPQ